ncbi:Sip1-related alpha-galactosidase [Gordoniibacillus kamchatkensis]|uniref:Sip1-related alpha-galactosidase n=1 Tax=Gordoniibacillus kamchatkensis TaxID=1590651 RepID=UPI000697F365|nr:Sip1-related alpha-galactosidase [Paenibacillus sp. VKM B-2647]
MFTCIDWHEGKGLTYKNETVFGAVSVSVRLDGRAPFQLDYQGCELQEGEDRFGGYAEYRHAFRSDDEKVGVRLTLRCYSHFALAYVDGAIEHANDFGTQRSFAPAGGISVTIKPEAAVRGLLANYQHKDWWTRPHFNPDMSQLPERTQSLLWQTDTAYYQLLPVCGPVFRTDLAGSSEGLTVRISGQQGGRNRCETLAFVTGAGDDPFRLMNRHVEIALDALNFPTLPRERKKYPEMLDYLGWCSWDAFYHQVNEEGLLAKLQELQELKLPVRWVMIDDGWSDTADGKLQAFEADADKFPRGLAHAVRELKDRFGVRWVGVWHTIVGYWGGIHPDSPLAKQLSDSLFTTAKGSLIPYPDAGRGFGFWHAWHSFLRRQGVDFVKVDSQSAVLNYLKYHRSIGEAAGAAHEALEASVALHFDGTIINCMGMASENIWHRPKSAVSRNSDDFVPKEAHGFPEHALQNAYNSYYHGPFYWGDWDMFWTQNHDDVQSAVLRSISGGPVYVSDAIGRTSPERVWPLIYRDGKLIRCDRTANPTADCLLANPTETDIPLKLWNTIGGSGAVAVFHIRKNDGPVSGSIGIEDVPELDPAKPYLLFEHFSRECQRYRAKNGGTSPFKPGNARCTC